MTRSFALQVAVQPVILHAMERHVPNHFLLGLRRAMVLKPKTRCDLALRKDACLSKAFCLSLFAAVLQSPLRTQAEGGVFFSAER